MYWENVNLSDEQSIIRCNYFCCFQLVGWWSAVLYLLNSNLLNLVFTTYISERLFASRNEATLASEKELMLLMMLQKHFYNNLKVKQQLTWAHWVYRDTEPSLKCTKLSYKQDLLPPRASKSQAVQCSWDTIGITRNNKTVKITRRLLEGFLTKTQLFDSFDNR